MVSSQVKQAFRSHVTPTKKPPCGVGRLRVGGEPTRYRMMIAVCIAVILAQIG